MSRPARLAARLSAAASLIALSSPAFALDAAPAAEETDVIVVTSAPIRVTSDELVGSVTVIDEDQLIRDLDGNIADTLERQPGVTSSYFGPASGRPIVRGLGAERVRVLINGLGGLDASTSSPDHAVAAEVLGATGVEVLRGPAAIAYGGNAIGGVVNILDGRVPTEPVDCAFDGFVYLGSTSVDDGTQLAGRLTGAIGPIVLQGDFVRREADGFEIPGYAETEEAHDDHDEDHGDHDDDHDDDHDHDEEERAFGLVEDAFYTFETASFGASLVQNWGYVGISVKDTEAEYGLPGHVHAHEHDDDHDDHDEDHDHEEEEAPVLVMDQTRIDLRGEHALGGFLNRLRWSFAHSDYGHAEIEEGEIGALFDLEGAELRIELAHDHDGVRQGAWGIQALAQDFAAIGEEAYIEPVTTQDWGLFATERWDFGEWGFEGGARIETRNLDGERAERTFDTISASGSFFFRPSEPWFLAATLSRTERAPSDVEVFAFGPHAATQTFEIGALDLGKETAWSGEATARWRGDRMRGEANLFYADYDGFIALFPTGAEEDGFDVFEYRQRDARLYGFELAGEAGLGAFAGFELTGEAGVDYVRAELDGGGDLPRIPPLSATLALIAEKGIWSARGEARLVAEQDEVAEFETPTDGYALLNADLVVSPFANRDVSLILGARNITDQEARVHTSFLKNQVPLPGRSFRIALRAGF
ncbi:MAG: TonB-dependent receptor [Oceanicaulis sp.]